MSDMTDDLDWHDEELDVTCKYCGKKGLEWVAVGGLKNRIWELFTPDRYTSAGGIIEGEMHKCKTKTFNLGIT